MAHHNYRTLARENYENAPHTVHRIQVPLTNFDEMHNVNIQANPQQDTIALSTRSDLPPYQPPPYEDIAALANLMDQHNGAIPLHLEQDTLTFIR